MRFKLVLVILLFVVVSCKTVGVNKQQQHVASTSLELGTVGETVYNLQLNIFESKAIPILKQKIRLSTQVLPFKKTTYKAYLKATELQGKTSFVKYVDSLKVHPFYLTLKIADKVSFLNELNADYNKSEFNYIKTVPGTTLISTLTIAFDSTMMDLIAEAEEFYLCNNKHKKYHLSLYKDKKQFAEIEFTNGVVFGYNLSSFCWGENERHQPTILNYVDEGAKCSKNTYSSFHKMNQKKETFKF